MNTSFLFLAEGFEEIEALATVDILRRAGIPVKTVSITESLQVKGAHGITVSADLIFDCIFSGDTHFGLSGTQRETLRILHTSVQGTEGAG